jgi:hypothetical protein
MVLALAMRLHGACRAMQEDKFSVVILPCSLHIITVIMASHP